MLYAPYHSAIRRSIRAFPTSNTKNILAESGMPHIRDRLQINTLRLIPKIFYTTNLTLYNKLCQAIKRKRRPKKQSTLCRVLQKTTEINISLKPMYIKPTKHPSWVILSSSFEEELMKYPKKSTSNDAFRQLFLHRKHQLQSAGWNFIYSDGSKLNGNTSFAVVSDNSDIIGTALLSSYCSVFSAEAYAIKAAILWALPRKGKFVVCTDSFSTIAGIKNMRNTSPVISYIRDNLITYKNKFKIMWVPGHCGIAGNEAADKAAKNVAYTPCFYVETYERSDILHRLREIVKKQHAEEWNGYNNRYRLINPSGAKVMYPTTCSNSALKVFCRLRIGHSALTHQHLLDKRYTAGCHFCNGTTTSTEHILDKCPTFINIRNTIFSSDTPSELLKAPTTENIKKNFKYISEAHLTKQI